MTRRRLVVSVAAVAAIAALPFVVWMVMPPQPGVTKANFDRIQEGMTVAEVERILGGNGTFVHVLLDEEHAAKKRQPMWVWFAVDGAQAVCFIDGGVVVQKDWNDSTETPIERIRRWLHL